MATDKINETMIRLESKLDSALSTLSDHEGRLRTTEKLVLLMKNIEEQRVREQTAIDKLESKCSEVDRELEKVKSSLETYKRVIWAISLATIGGIVNLIFRWVEGYHAK